MKLNAKSSLIFLILLVASENTIAREIEKENITRIGLPGVLAEQDQEPRAIPGSHFLRDKMDAFRDDLKRVPPDSQTAVYKKTAWNFTVGDEKEWWAYDFTSESDYLVPSTCRAVGENCYIFVEDSMWDVISDYTIKQNHIDSLVAYFDDKTPANSTRGIYSTVTGTFGEPPDVDSDPKIVILVLDIKDGYDPDGNSGFVAGYFYGLNQTTYPHSNEAEIFYMDANPVDMDSYHLLQSALATLSHEFQHMVHFKNNEIAFIDEGCSEIAEVVCGFSLRSPGRYFSDTDKYLFGWDDSDGTHLDDYSRAALWTLYLYEQLPPRFLRNLVDEPETGIDGIELAIKTSQTSPSRLVPELFNDWIMANVINDREFGTEFGYNLNVEGRPAAVHQYYQPPGSEISETVSSYGTDYISFIGLSELNITFSGSDKIDIRALKLGSAVEIEVVPVGLEYSIPDFGEQYDEIVFVVSNTTTLSKSYSFLTTGNYEDVVIEHNFNTGEPDGYLNWDEGDSVAVWFPGVEGTSIDSLKLAFRHSGKAQLSLWEYNGDLPDSPIGANLVPDTTLTVEIPSFSHPYPVPYPGWVTLDLTGLELPGDKDFVLIYVFNDTVNEPELMITADPNNTPYHSWHRETDDSRWWVSGYSGEIYNYLVRAFLTLPGTAVEVAATEETSLPDSYTLSQNYPNPFNPVTTFDFQISARMNVRIDIYDLKGALIKTLTNKSYSSGTHTIRWMGVNSGGSPVPSGIYMAVMQVEGHRLSRKMILLK